MNILIPITELTCSCKRVKHRESFFLIIMIKTWVDVKNLILNILRLKFLNTLHTRQLRCLTSNLPKTTNIYYIYYNIIYVLSVPT